LGSRYVRMLYTQPGRESAACRELPGKNMHEFFFGRIENA
jgi:hypothetical protein